MKLPMQEKDIVLSELGISLARMGAVTYGFPHIIGAVTYSYPAPRRIDSYAALLWPFTVVTWVTVIVCLVVNSIVIKIFGVSYGDLEEVSKVFRRAKFTIQAFIYSAKEK